MRLRDAEGMWILQTTASDRALHTFRVMPGVPRTIGRANVADFVVDGPLVSRVHCRVLVGPTGVLEVEDLDSTNGTFVNERRVSRAVLVAGDRLRIGRVEMRVSRSGDNGGR